MLQLHHVFVIQLMSHYVYALLYYGHAALHAAAVYSARDCLITSLARADFIRHENVMKEERETDV